jgi:hypothetical protein
VPAGGYQHQSYKTGLPLLARLALFYIRVRFHQVRFIWNSLRPALRLGGRFYITMAPKKGIR